MPRYFFDICNDTIYRDEEGIVLTNDGEARSQGVVTAGEMIRNEKLDSLLKSEWTMTIKNEIGSTLLKLRFSAMAFDRD